MASPKERLHKERLFCDAKSRECDGGNEQRIGHSSSHSWLPHVFSYIKNGLWAEKVSKSTLF